MLDQHVPEVLRRIPPDALVLDVGGWGRCFNRADYVIDKLPYETRGSAYASKLGLGPQGGEVERFTAETWITRDLCDRRPWPFPDKFFDYCTCSHTLEDIRDPIWVCSEMRRVARAGYIETPSMAFELTRGREPDVPVGLSHHFWIVEADGSTITFMPKLHFLHGDPRLSLPPGVGASLPADRLVTWLFWEGEFEAREGWLHRECVERFVSGFGPEREEAGDGLSRVEVDRQLFELSRANEQARSLIWELQQRLAEAEDQGRSARHAADHFRDQVDRTLARLHATTAERDELLARLAPLEAIGPGSLEVARQVHHLCRRHPRLRSLFRRVIRAA